MAILTGNTAVKQECKKEVMHTILSVYLIVKIERKINNLSTSLYFTIFVCLFLFDLYIPNSEIFNQKLKKKKNQV